MRTFKILSNNDKTIEFKAYKSCVGNEIKLTMNV